MGSLGGVALLDDDDEEDDEDDVAATGKDEAPPSSPVLLDIAVAAAGRLCLVPFSCLTSRLVSGLWRRCEGDVVKDVALSGSRAARAAGFGFVMSSDKAL